jgi:hypothetical protein
VPVSEKLLRELPIEVVNELAILEDRAIRAEQRAGRLEQRNDELLTQVTQLRAALATVTELASELQSRAIVDAGHIEDALRRVLVIQAG